MNQYLQILQDLESQQIEKQAEAIDNAIVIFLTIITKAIEKMEHSHNPMFLAERLIKFGTIIKDPLLGILNKKLSDDCRVVASLMLIQFGCSNEIEFLLESINNDSIYSGLIANKLAEVNAKEVYDIIIDKLRSPEIINLDTVVSMLNAIKKMNKPLPVDIETKFSEKTVPWQIKSMVTEISNINSKK